MGWPIYQDEYKSEPDNKKMESKTIDQKAAEYAELTQLEKDTYKGDVETAYTCGYLQAETDVIVKLFKTKQFTISKIAEMTGKRVMQVRNALNSVEW